MSILSENLNQIREPMEVYCGMTANLPIALTITKGSGTYNVRYDSNLSEALQNDWTLLDLAYFDPPSIGVVLDGSQVMYEDDHVASATNGKYGLVIGRSNFTNITISASQTIPAVALIFPQGTGTIVYTYNGESVTTPIRSAVTIPVDATSATIRINATSKTVLSSATAGAKFEWTNDDLISVRLDLRSNLDRVNPSYEVSSIEIRAYYPEDLSEIMQVFGEGVPIWYYAGYSDDYSETRNFYLAQPAAQEKGVITLNADDASSLLEEGHVNLQVLQTSRQNGLQRLYRWMIKQIEDCGITVRYEEEPAIESGEDLWRSIVFLDASTREHIANIMAYSRMGGWYPRYVDAGIPTIEWSEPTAKWDIYEEDCGDVVRRVERSIKKITTESDYGIESDCVCNDDWETVQTGVKVKTGKRTTLNFSDQWWWAYSIPNVRRYIWKNLDTVQWISDTTGEVTVRGKECYWSPISKSVKAGDGRIGFTEKIDVLTVGGVDESSGGQILPNWHWVFQRSTKGGSFKWKGNPQMQPRDVFRFHRLNGETILCTIEAIELTHEGGGTYADISYREGVV